MEEGNYGKEKTMGEGKEAEVIAVGEKAEGGGHCGWGKRQRSEGMVSEGKGREGLGEREMEGCLERGQSASL